MLGWAVSVIGYGVWRGFDLDVMKGDMGWQWYGWNGLVGMWAAIEAGWLFGIVVMSGWGARPWEGFGESVRRGLKRGLSVTVFGGVILGFVAVGVECVHVIFDTANVGYGDPAGLYMIAVFGVFVVGCWVWPGLVLVWAMGVGSKGWDWQTGEGMRELWPLRCEGEEGKCGYQLVNLKRGTSCPECGLAVKGSVEKKCERYAEMDGGVFWWEDGCGFAAGLEDGEDC
ncbi:hypothetical protein KS4_12490 [Poriferisphaera corsica]|uniref:Uncharacterized protein n=1 Tax=Poriferisphaera corsica TaxID=2528020 RepID=A0A517YSL7_9BACT|nr:hypothetical protein KS4_12490 [Poriferisphaera corsica]